MNNDWKHKYLKYKHKYLDLCNQTGGNLIFHKDTKTGIYHLQKIHQTTGIPVDVPSTSSQFTSNERVAIDDMVNYILPQMMINGSPLTSVASEQIKVMNVGAFGITVYFGELIIKIIRVSEHVGDVDSVSTAEEIFTLKYLTDGTSKSVEGIKDDRKYINSLYGYITSNDIITHRISQLCIDAGIPSRRSIIPYTSYDTSLSNKDDYLTLPLKLNYPSNGVINTSNTLIFLFMKKGEIDAEYYFNKPNINLRFALQTFIDNVSKGLRYVHHSGFIHNDIKPPNIIFVNDGNPRFQLIDFGLSTRANFSDISPVKSRRGSPYMFINSKFDIEKSFMYDWHCLYISILELLGGIKLTTSSVYNDVNIKKPSGLNERDINTYTTAERMGLVRQFIINLLHDAYNRYNIVLVKFEAILIVNPIIVLAYAHMCHRAFFDVVPKSVIIKLFDRNTAAIVSYEVKSQKAYEDLLMMVIADMFK